MKKLLCLILALVLFLALASCQAQAASDEGGMDEDHLFKPLQWFGDLPDGSELVDWDIYDDENATGLLLYFYTDPQVGVDLFEAYTDQLDSCGDVLRVSKEDFDSGFSGSDNDTDRESLYRYLSRKVGAVTAMRSGKYCDFAVHQLWLDEDVLVVALAWGEDFPIEVDPDDLVALDIDELPDELPDVSDELPDVSDEQTDGSDEQTDELPDGPIIPDAWAFFNEEVTHEDKSIENGTQVLFMFDSDHAKAAYEYVDLLKNGGFGLTLTGIWSREQDRSMPDGTHYYYFDSDGLDEGLLEPYGNGSPGTCAVVVHINDWPDYGCEVAIQFSDDLTVVDTGDRCSVTGLADHKEALAGPMGGKGPRSGDADYTMRVGDSLQLDCPRKFGANTEQFRWAVDEGADLVSLKGEISSSCTVTAQAPGRVVVSVVYDHSYDTTDVLTGNDTYGFAAPTYYFIIEITN